MEQITLTTEELDRLLALQDGDAALVYLCSKRQRIPSLTSVRLGAAQKKLHSAGLAAPVNVERPSYGAKEISDGMLTDPGFHAVINEAERLAGRPLSGSDQQILFSIYRWRSLPPEVVLMLLNYCDHQKGKRPFTLRMVDREAEIWEREELFDVLAAESYIAKKDAAKEETSKAFSRIGIFGREPSATEKKYVSAWLSMGFTVDAIALAYDKTVVNTGKLAWGYCDKILQRWHQQGWHTPEEIESGDKRKKSAPVRSLSAPIQKGGSVSRAKEALRQIQEEERQNGFG